jgi:hypothetical protein
MSEIDSDLDTEYEEYSQYTPEEYIRLNKIWLADTLQNPKRHILHNSHRDKFGNWTYIGEGTEHPFGVNNEFKHDLSIAFGPIPNRKIYKYSISPLRGRIRKAFDYPVDDTIFKKYIECDLEWNMNHKNCERERSYYFDKFLQKKYL